MTRRLTVVILLSVWGTLCVAGVAAYWATRAALLTDLDETLRLRAAALPELMPRDALAGNTPEGGRYVIQSEGSRRTLPRATGGGSGFEPELIAASFNTLADGQRLRAVTVRAVARPTAEGEPPLPVVVTYSGSAETFFRTLDRLGLTFLACGVAAGVAAAVAARRLSRATLRPLTKIAELIGEVDESRLSRRVPVESLPPELTATGARLNEMLAKLQESFERRQQFLADASHELRTPVAALVTGLEVALMRDRAPEAYRRIVGDALADAEILRQLVERLMEQARSERLAHAENFETHDLTPLLRQCVRAAAVMGEANRVTVSADVPPELCIRTQPGRLRSIVTNLLANAVEYNRQGGSVALRAWTSESSLHLIVSDTGVGIAPEQQEAIFQPFYRGDAARSGGGRHLGLGLHAVRTHVAALSGTCVLASEVGIGSEFHVTLPFVTKPATQNLHNDDGVVPASHETLIQAG